MSVPSPIEYRVTNGDWEYVQPFEACYAHTLSGVVSVAKRWNWVHVSIQAQRRIGGELPATWKSIPHVIIGVGLLQLILACREEVLAQ